MKSAIFESINDRSNIANAYLKMVNEANEAMEQKIAEVASLYEDKDYPICVYEYGPDGRRDTVIDLFDVEQRYKDPSYYAKGYDDYYIALAFDMFGNDELYRKILEKDDGFYIPPERLSSLQNGFLNTVDDLERTLEEIGRDADEEQHEDMIEVSIPEWAAVYFVNDDDSGLTPEDKKMADDYIKQIESQGYVLSYDGENLGFCRHPEFGLADNCIKFYLVKSSEQNESVEESANGWFDSYGNLVKDLPEECIKDCTVPGRDAYESCKYWVNELGFANGLDIPLAKGYLKWTGGWEDDEIASLDDEETAIKILWILANDAKEGLDILSIGDGGRFDDSSSTVTESRFHNHKVILTNIQWPNGAYDDGMNLPGRDSMTIEVGDNENIENIIRNVYIDSYGVAPVNFHIARNVDLGFVEVGDGKKPKKSRKNEMVSQSDIDKLKKKNPKLKDISEER